MIRSFLERFLYPLTSYQIGENGEQIRILGKRIIPAGMIFTMNANNHFYGAMHYEATLGSTTHTLEYLLGYVEQYNSLDTLQFKDYSVMEANRFDAAEKKHHHETQFPIDEQKCFEMDVRLVEKAKSMAL